MSLVDAPSAEPQHTGRGKAQSPLVPLPEDFALAHAMRAYAHARLLDCDVEALFEAFCNHHRAHGKKMKSWPAAWRTWVGNAQRFGYPKLAPPKGLNGLPVLNG
jgi:hypothetical protein